MATKSFRRPNLVLAALISGVTLIAGSQSYAQDAVDNLEDASLTAMQRGQQALEAEEFEAAREAFSEAIATSPSDPRGYIGRATALAGLELPQDALTDFKTAMDYTNSSNAQAKALRAETQFQRGRMYLEMGNQFIGTALPDLQAAHEFNRGDLRYAYSLGKAYAIASPYSPGAGEQAEPLLTEYLEQNPDDAEALRLRGTAFGAMNKVDEAFADLSRAVELDPTDHENYLTQATIYITQEDYAPAVDALKAAIENFEPEEGQEDVPFAQGYLTLAVVYEEMGKQTDDPAEREQGYNGSIATCKKVLEMLPDEDQYKPSRAAALFRKGVGHRLLKQYGEAVKSLSEAIEINPEMSEAYFRRAICFAEMQEEGLALRDLKDTQALKFGDARSYLWEGIVYAQKGEYREAIRSYNTAITFSNRYLDAYLNRAHAYFQLGEFDSAIESFNECIRLQPEAAVYYFKRGLCFQNLEEMDQAIRSYMNAVQFDEGYTPAYDMLIPALEQQGRTELANQYRAKRAQIDGIAN